MACMCVQVVPAVPSPSPAPAQLSYPDALARFLGPETSDQLSPLRASVLSQLPPPPSFFQRLLCMSLPELTPALKEQQASVKASVEASVKGDASA